MRHHQFIEAAAFDPKTLVLIETAFNSAWSHFGYTDAELARTRYLRHVDRGRTTPT